jgi:predicted ATPase/class 3 adenylate cyclase
MESLLAFIPEDRRLALAAGLDLPDRTTGSVLFADISGFTPLTAALAQEMGVQRGAEEVLNQINPVYEAIIAELHRYGGSVMGFAGDSITCWFAGDTGARGVACALAMQLAMQPFATVKTPAGTPITLAIKVAVAAGPARRFIVGDPQIQLIDVLAGRTLDEVAAAEKLAEKGEVVVSRPVADALGGAAEVVEWRQSAGGERFAVIHGLHNWPAPAPHPPLAAVNLSDEQTRSWALPPIYSRLQSGERFLAELRPSVALFLKFSGIDYDNDEDAGRKLDAYVRWLQATAQKQEGFLIQLTIGDKGSYAYVSFGAPVAHADDSIRAVAAALDFQQLPAELDFMTDIQIGISRGRVWAGECGARLRHTYGVMGNEVNMAARLMGKAQPGKILVRRRVAEEARAFDFKQVGLMTVKGGAEPIPVAELVGRPQTQITQSTQFDLPLIGRDGQRAQLDRVLDSVLAHEGQFVTLQGPTGIGKSHLLSVFQQTAAAHGFQVATAASQYVFQSATYYPWQQIMRQVLGLGDSLPDQSADAAAADWIATIEQTLLPLNPDWLIRLPLLGDLLGLPIPENPTTAAFDPKQRQESLFAFVAEILRVWSRSQPLCLVFDNAHWLDEASRGLLESVAKATSDAPILLIAAVRPVAETGSTTAALGAIRNLLHHQLLELGELDPVAIEELVAAILGGRASLLANLLIAAKAQGNPFFVRELVDALREGNQLVEVDGQWVLSESMIEAMRKANVLTRDDGTWVLARSADLTTINLGIPDSVHGVILARLDRLPDTHKPTIKVASVIGYSFELGLVAQVHPSNPPRGALREQAHVLEERDFIMQDWEARLGASQETYTFRQQATQEVSYETLLFTQRRELHKRLAALLEEQSPEAVGQIAYHAYLGEDWPRSLRFHLLAGAQDKQLFANLQSIEHYRRALTSADHLPPQDTLSQRQQIHADLGELLLTIGQIDEGQEHLQTALALAQELGNMEAQAWICRWMARGYEQRGQYAPALDWINRGLTVLGDRLTPAALELRLIAGLIFTRQGEYQRASQQAIASMLAAEELSVPSIVARSHNLLGNIDHRRGRASEAATHFEEALALYKELGNLQGQAQVLNSLGSAYFDLGQWADADAIYRQAGQTFTQLGNIYNRLFVDNNLGGIALNQGRLDDALHYYRRALSALESIGGSLFVTGVLHLNLGATHIRRSELPVALEHLYDSQRLLEQAQGSEMLPELHRRMAEAFLAQQDYAGARAQAEQSLALAEELAATGEQGMAWQVMGAIQAAQGQTEAAEASLEKAIGLLRNVGNDYGLACSQLFLAQLHGHRQAERRDNLLRECLPTFERLGALIEMEQAQALMTGAAQPDHT